MRSKYVGNDVFELVTRRMVHENALALRVSRETGLHIDDVLSIKSAQIRENKSIVVREKKTGKENIVVISDELRKQMRNISGLVYVWENKRDFNRHRSRQAVYMNMKVWCKRLALNPARISPHSARKIYAVDAFRRSKSLDMVQQLLNHKYSSTTMIYAFSDMLDANEDSEDKQ